ncbi:type I-E CRISPR-associated protein Cse2/CasB [Limosilactobacillus mucosae]|uniref:type I-E CRISPR-associated protein Cse2/CasB n=1 Tax=Limosilactobacillus mucosae TaxID=97478 RepID=UPI004039E54D
MANEIAKVTAQIIYSLYNNGDLDKAVLASLRHAVTIKDHRAENVWPIMFSKMAASDISSDPQGRETRQETAIYTALRCFAIYQQGLTQLSYASSNQVSTEDKGQQLFVALADLRKNQDKQAALDRRIQNLLSSTNIDSVTKSVTQLVRILKSADRNLLLDFSQLAQDLFFFQMGYEYSRQVFLKWGRQYYWQSVSTN